MKRLTAMLASLTAVVAGAMLLAPTAAHAAPAANAAKRALIVGVSQYDPPTVPTVGGAGDAVATRDLLVHDGFAKDNIRMLVDGEATADNIRAGFDWLAASSTSNTLSVFHYSGHTKQQVLPDGEQDDEEFHEFMWSVDNQFISDRELASRVQQIQGNAWIDIAGCEAAGFDNGISSPSRLFTAASQENEKAYELSSAGRSVYSQMMIGALSGGATIQKAFAATAAAAPTTTADQQPYGPQHPYLAGGGSGEWSLGAAAAPSGGLEGLLSGLLTKLLGPLAPQTPGR